MSKFDKYYFAEDIIEDLLRKELIGPVTEGEILFEPPLLTYEMGILWPQRTTTEKTKIKIFDEGNDFDLNVIRKESQYGESNVDIGVDAVAGFDVNTDNGINFDTDIGLDANINANTNISADMGVVEEIENILDSPNNQLNLTNTYRPSAMAISIVVSGEEDLLLARFNCGKYLHEDEEVIYEKKVQDENGSVNVIKKKIVQNKYIRTKVDCGNIIFDLKTSKIVSKSNIPSDIGIELFIRKTYADGSRLITISVKNNAYSHNKEVLLNTSALFQCHLSVISIKGFLPITPNEYENNDIEIQTLNMLYRDVLSYATGHGCSVKWHGENNVVNIIESEFMPVAEVLQMEPRHMAGFRCLNLKYWNDSVKEDGCSDLEKVIAFYQSWLLEQRKKSVDIKAYKKAINRNFANIELCIERLKQGVNCLRSNDLAWKAFIYMNEAMLLQRVNYAKTKKITIEPSSVNWYPFQLMYILQIIPDIIDKNCVWRDKVDLLWFPTGGGKTEAYLGLIAFAIFYRRLSKGQNGNGVTVIMRYTLRLLTAQQFERASALICACEFLRNKYSIAGCEISIGLWVGMDLTPNTLLSAKENIERIKEGETVHRGNPMQIFHCPFCGKDFDIGDYKIEKTLKIKCPNADCFFYNGLPVYLIDEDIYNKRPTLILSTIDKFARIVWEEKTVAIFGSDGNTEPPELIIQDELHLISGPLGSISGLYEMAIDELCTKNGSRPKIIACTATIRNAERQIKSLYNRDSFQFPPQGVDIKDSFFAVYADRNSKPARRYMGICDTGGSLLDILVHVYGCLLFAVKYLEGLGVDKDVIDQYFTIVGYFNALKDLGSSATIITDRVESYGNSLRVHKFKNIAESVKMEKISIYSCNELTSRKSSKEIKDTLEEIEIKYPDERAYSYLLASNMLSVGIDIGRLGVMTVYGQPKTTAEYIQATSRVGRNSPGIVMPLYSGMRSRDKSHYEQFIYYHQTFYKHVEPTSVTPFSFRAIEKALHAVYVALIRHKIPYMRENEDVVNFRKNDPEILKIKELILRRIYAVDDMALEYARDWLEWFESLWEKAVKSKGEKFYYSLKGNMTDATYTLLVEAEKDNLTDFPSTLNALRNVDSSSNVYIIDRQSEDE